jgi:hypothetical protein
MSTALPVETPEIDETQIGLVDEGRRLEGVIAPLAGEMGSGHPVQLVVDERQELVQSRGISSPPIEEELAYTIVHRDDSLYHNSPVSPDGC